MSLPMSLKCQKVQNDPLGARFVFSDFIVVSSNKNAKSKITPQQVHHQGPTSFAKKSPLVKDLIEDYYDLTDVMTLQDSFSKWQMIVNEQKAKEKKANFVYEQRLIMKVFDVWKKYAREVKTDRALEKLEKETQEAEAKLHLAKTFQSKKLLKRAFLSWRRYVMDGKCLNKKTKLRMLIDEREQSRAKMQQFVDELNQLKRNLGMNTVNDVKILEGRLKHLCLGNKNPHRALPYQWRISNEVLDPDVPEENLRAESLDQPGLSVEAVQFFNDQWGLTDLERQSHVSKRPIISRNMTSKVQQKLKLQNWIIQEQRKRLREKEKDILELREMKEQMTNGRAITNKTLEKFLNENSEQGLMNNKSDVLSSDMFDLSHSDSYQRELISFRRTNDFQGSSQQIRNIVIGTCNPAIEGESKDNSNNVSERKNIKPYQTRRMNNLNSKPDFKTQATMTKKSHRIVGIADRNEKKECKKQPIKKGMPNIYGYKQLVKKQESLEKKADLHYRLFLLKSYGLRPWKNYVSICKKNKKVLIAQKHEEFLMEKYFRKWVLAMKLGMDMKDCMARQFLEIRLQRKVLKAWKKELETSKSRLQSASDYYDLNLLFKSFFAWKAVYDKRSHFKLEVKALQHRNRYLHQKYFDRWRLFAFLKTDVFDENRERFDVRMKHLAQDFRSEITSNIFSSISEEDEKVDTDTDLSDVSSFISDD